MGRQRITRADLARALDTTDMWLSRRLNDQVPLSLDDLDRIAEVLNVSPSSLIETKASA